jgi:hypothetical protein
MEGGGRRFPEEQLVFPGEPSEDNYTIIRAQDVWGSYDAG